MSQPFDYSVFTETATNLIAQFGREVDYVRPSTTPDDSARPWGKPLVGGETTVPAVRTAFFDTRKGESPLAEEFDAARPSEQVTEMATFALVAAQAALVGLSPLWRIEDGSRRWEILAVQEIAPGPTLIYYRMEVR